MAAPQRHIRWDGRQARTRSRAMPPRTSCSRDFVVAEPCAGVRAAVSGPRVRAWTLRLAARNCRACVRDWIGGVVKKSASWVRSLDSDMTVALVGRPLGQDTDRVNTSRSPSPAPAGYRFPREMIAVAVRWYLRYGLSYRDVQELLAERGVTVDHVTVYRWVQTSTAEFIDAGRWTYLYRAVDQHGQVIDVLVAERRDARAAREFFTRALKHGPAPIKITTDRAPVYPRVIEDRVPGARHVLERYQNNRVETDHGRPKARLRPMRGVTDHPVTTRPRVRTRLRAEPTPRALRAHRRCRCSRPRPHRTHRTRPPLGDRAATATQ